ncbi:MAG: hypothetical protein ABIU87_06600 [Ornithinibacter sp.]
MHRLTRWDARWIAVWAQLLVADQRHDMVAISRHLAAARATCAHREIPSLTDLCGVEAMLTDPQPFEHG